MSRLTSITGPGASSRSLASFLAGALLPALIMFLSTPSSPAGSATWNLTPPSNSWGNTANWTPQTVPNSSSDTATFGVSNTKGVTIAFPLSVQLRGLLFEAGASAFTITLDDANLTFDGLGVKNDSGVSQNFVVNYQGDGGILFFNDGTSAGSGTIYTLEFDTAADFYGTSTAAQATFNNLGGSFFDDKLFFGGREFFGDTSTADRATFNNQAGVLGTGAPGGLTAFDGTANAGHAIFNNIGAAVAGAQGGYAEFSYTSTAYAGTFNNFGASVSGGNGGTVLFNGFFGSPMAGRATFHNYGAAFAGTFGEGSVSFFSGTPSAAKGTFMNDGGAASGAPGGQVSFGDSSTAGDASFANHGGVVAGAGGGLVMFSGTSNAGNATLVNEDGAVSGAAGGATQFLGDSSGGTARVEVFGAGNLDISSHNAPGVTVGSIEGTGAILLAANRLTVGSNNQNTIFSGVIDDGGVGGSLGKLGTGTLTLTGSNTYTGGTVIDGGALLLRNERRSATGSGAVQVNAGSLGGIGAIQGAVTIGTGSGSGALLAPGMGEILGKLVCQGGLTLNSDATYNFGLDSSGTTADRVVANGVTINAGAQFSLADSGSGKLATGTVFIVISNTAATPIAGTFSNLADGATLTLGSNTYQASYEGGDGNDFTLTVLP